MQRKLQNSRDTWKYSRGIKVKEMKLCPKCNKKGNFGFFDTPDESGTHAMFSHRTGKIEIFTDFMGNKQSRPEVKHCFLTLDDLKKTGWFSEWFKQREKENKQYAKEQEAYWNKQYVEEYYKEVENERRNKT